MTLKKSLSVEINPHQNVNLNGYLDISTCLHVNSYWDRIMSKWVGTSQYPQMIAFSR